MLGLETFQVLCKEAHAMNFVPSFGVLLQELSVVMTTPSFESFLLIASGWVFARRRTVTAMIQAAGPWARSITRRFTASLLWRTGRSTIWGWWCST
jgi:hypothetical protein